MASKDFIVIDLELTSDAEFKRAARAALKDAHNTIWNALPLSVKQRITRAQADAILTRTVDVPVYAWLSRHLEKTNATLAAIQGVLESAKDSLINATPVSQERKRYFAGTHRDHGATKKGWHRNISKRAKEWHCTFSNDYPNRVRFVEHGFERPEKWADEKAMMWQMDTDPKTVLTWHVRALPHYPGLFFVAKTKESIKNQLQTILSTQPNLVDRAVIDYGGAYTYK